MSAFPFWFASHGPERRFCQALTIEAINIVDDGVNITVKARNAQIHVVVRPREFSYALDEIHRLPLDTYIYNLAKRHQELKASNSPWYRIVGIIETLAYYLCPHLQSVIRRLIFRPHNGGEELYHNFAFPMGHDYRLICIGPVLELLAVQPERNNPAPPLLATASQLTASPAKVDPYLPVYSSKELVVESVLDRKYLKSSIVSFAGFNMVARAAPVEGLYDRVMYQDATRGYEILQRFNRTHRLRVAHVVGYIRNHDTQRIVGTLTKYIPWFYLNEVEPRGFSQDERNKWLIQVRDTLNRLHEAGTY